MKFFSKKIQHDRIPIAVDFDGVIHKYSKGFFDGSIYDKPVDGVAEALRELQKHYYIYIFSNRNETPEGEMAVLEYLNKHEIPFDKISATKPPAKFFIDDGAIRFFNWDQVKKDLDFFQKI